MHGSKIRYAVYGKTLPARLKNRQLRTMTYDFFANKTDKLEILDFIFKETDLKIYDLGSPYGLEICEYKSVNDIDSKFDLDNGDKFAMNFQLWTPRHKGKPVFRKINLDPKHCNGHTFRYSTDGWGLIQLYFGGLKNNELNQSHIGHFTEKEALKNEILLLLMAGLILGTGLKYNRHQECLRIIFIINCQYERLGVLEF
jgi:hypothetical protein